MGAQPPQRASAEAADDEVPHECQVGRDEWSPEANELVLGDALKSARVRGKITAHGRGDKVLVFKFKRKKQYKRTIGHRQNYTRVQVQEIVS